jgi:MATE family, multidrug efflux pump
MFRRSPHDREIRKLALPALGALAAEPLYLLVDTAIVGHLGTPQLAALALAGTVLTGTFTMFNFLTYGTTAQVARCHGAGREDVAGTLAAQALWLASGIGALLLVWRWRSRRPRFTRPAAPTTRAASR